MKKFYLYQIVDGVNYYLSYNKQNGTYFSNVLGEELLTYDSECEVSKKIKYLSGENLVGSY